jgi:hypothetical protein
LALQYEILVFGNGVPIIFFIKLNSEILLHFSKFMLMLSLMSSSIQISVTAIVYFMGVVEFLARRHNTNGRCHCFFIFKSGYEEPFFNELCSVALATGTWQEKGYYHAGNFHIDYSVNHFREKKKVF